MNNHHHLHHQWRFPPSAGPGADLCPVCSVHHFPFCPPPPLPHGHLHPNGFPPPGIHAAGHPRAWTPAEVLHGPHKRMRIEEPLPPPDFHLGARYPGAPPNPNGFDFDPYNPPRLVRPRLEDVYGPRFSSQPLSGAGNGYLPPGLDYRGRHDDMDPDFRGPGNMFPRERSEIGSFGGFKYDDSMRIRQPHEIAPSQSHFYNASRPLSSVYRPSDEYMMRFAHESYNGPNPYPFHPSERTPSEMPLPSQYPDPYLNGAPPYHVSREEHSPRPTYLPPNSRNDKLGPAVFQLEENASFNSFHQLNPMPPSVPPPPLPPAPPVDLPTLDYHSPPVVSSALFPVLSNCSTATTNASISHNLPLEVNNYSGSASCSVPEHVPKGITSSYHPPVEQYTTDRKQPFGFDHSPFAKSSIVDASTLFKQPHRASRPDHIVIILRGIPGSGKSYLAKALRDLEVNNGGDAPRIHAMDDYFMIEVEKAVDDNEGTRSLTASKGKRQLTKKVIEYCYEPEMEESYRASMLKAFKKTLDEGNFKFVIVDDRNLRVADFAQFWANAKRAGYEVYLLEAPYRDPTGCAARNVHGFSLDDIQKMAHQWEDAAPLYLRLDIQSLFHGDELYGHSIQEVDMDTDDDNVCSNTNDNACNEEVQKEISKSIYASDKELSASRERTELDEEEYHAGVRELGKSKWTEDFDEDVDNAKNDGNISNALAGLIQAYGKKEKSVRWGDWVEKGGFSIGKKRTASLIMGSGPGYNLDSNPLINSEEGASSSRTALTAESKKRFTEKLRAERESYKEVRDKRRHRIEGLDDEDD